MISLIASLSQSPINKNEFLTEGIIGIDNKKRIWRI
jgi:hypothetical protein